MRLNFWLSVAVGVIGAVVSQVGTLHAGIVTFGQGANTFQMEFVTIGNPGNANDTTLNIGRVEYSYSIGKFEVRQGMIDAHNAAPDATRSLTYYDLTGYGGNGSYKPAGIDKFQAMDFVNWLNTSTGGHKAYNSDGFGNIFLWGETDTLDYQAANPLRSKRARFVLPDYNEWHKAAYYDPDKAGGAGGYWIYATGSDTAPTAVASGTGSNEAVWNFSQSQGPADVNQAGGLNPYDVMGMNGNVFEWEEGQADFLYDRSPLLANQRGGAYSTTDVSQLSSSFRGGGLDGDLLFTEFGFRVVMLETVPEPSSMVIGALFGLGGLIAKRRIKR